MFLNLKIKKMKKTFLLIMIISFSSFESYAKTIDMDLCNFIQINETEFRVDVRVRNTTADPSGAGAIAIGQWAIRISLNPSLNNGLSTPYSCGYVGNTTLTAGENVPVAGNTQAYWSPNTYFQSFSSGVTPIQPTTLLNSTDWVYIGTFKMQCKNGASLKNWANFAPNLSWTAGTFNGMLECNWYDDGQGNGTLSILRSDATDYPVTVNYTVTIPNNTVPLYSYAYTGTGSWSTTANWNTSCSTGNGKNIIPSATDNISIGKYTNSTTPGATAGTCTLDANPTVNNLNITSGSTVNVAAAKELTVSNTLVNNGALNLLSANGTGTATILTPATLSGAGTYSVQQYLAPSRNWYISSPVASAPKTVLDATNATVYDYTEPTAAWNATADANLIPTKGYVGAVNATGGTVSFAGGALNNGDLSTGVLSSTDGTFRGFNLIGNPYPSYLDWTSGSITKTNLETSIWYRTLNGSAQYVYDTYNTTGSVGTALNGTAVTGVIAPMQAFWVRVPVGQIGGVTFSNTARTHSDQSVASNRLKAPGVAAQQQVLRLQVSNGQNIDEAIVVFNAKAADGYDTFDSHKMSNNNAAIPEIYTMAGTEKVVINGLSSVNANPALSLGFTTGTASTFTIKATEIDNFDADTRIILKDNLLNIEKELNIGTDYSFTSSATTTDSRFTVLFRSASTTTGIDTNVAETVTVFQQANGQLMINRNNDVEGSIIVSNAMGQQLLKLPTTGTSTVLDKSFGKGIYFVTLNVAGKSTTKKLILN